MAERILCVDDEPRVLEGIERMLGDELDISTATSGVQGLARLTHEGPFAVVVSDMRMPQMDGATFLHEVRKRAPDTMRVLLTGETDVKSAIRAVNDGAIFRFLTKPCPPELLRAALEAACAQSRLVRAERELLEHTLQGVIGLLGEVLGIVSPAAALASRRSHALVKHVVAALGIQNGWKIEAAAQLSQLGCVALPPALVEAGLSGAGMSPQDREAFRAHSATTQRLLADIPRLEEVGAIIRAATEPLPAAPTDDLSRGALLLALANDVARAAAGGKPMRAAIEAARLRMVPGQRGFDDALASFRDAPDEPVLVRVKDLRAAMVLAEPLVTKTGVTLASVGQEITALALERIRRFAESAGLPEAVRVRLPRSA